MEWFRALDTHEAPAMLSKALVFAMLQIDICHGLSSVGSYAQGLRGFGSLWALDVLGGSGDLVSR